MKLIDNIRSSAQQNIKTIVLPEGLDERTIKAARILKDDNLVEPIILGNEAKIKELAASINVNLNLSSISIIDPENAINIQEYADAYYEMRKHKGISKGEAETIIKDPLYYGAMMVKKGAAVGAVAGAAHTTGDVLRAAIQIIRTAEGIKVVSSSFLMVMPSGQVLTFGDCAVIPDPSAEELASIAISSAHTHKMLTGEEPRVAMLSFSTKGSAKHPLVDKVTEATEIIHKQAPELLVDGELQFDAAYLENVGKKKAPGSPVAGKANVFIFPDLSAGNIGYKLVERLA
ncbi:MAG: phosphate acetyltransferase, partial [Calditrichia bacterium]|nr:phosphate acetyltransferase [Calditrichia bacterium]